MNKEELKNFPSNPYLNVVCIIIFSFIGMGGIYYLTLTQDTLPRISTSELKLYLFFVILNFGVLMMQVIQKVRNQANIIIFIIALALYIISFLLRQNFRGDLSIFVLSQGLAMAGTLFIAMSLEFALIHLMSGGIINEDNTVVLLAEDVSVIISSLTLFILFTSSLPLLAFEQPNFGLMWSLLWSGIIMVYLLVVSAFNYRGLRKEAVIGNDDLVLEYRSIMLYLLASEEKMRQYDKLKQLSKNKIASLEMQKDNKLDERGAFEAIEESKPTVLKEIRALDVTMKRFDIQLIEKSIMSGVQKLKEIDLQVWTDNFAPEHEAIIATLDASQLQLQTAKGNLEQAEDQASAVRAELEDAKFQFEDLAETQTVLKEKRTDLVHRKSDYLDEIQGGDLDGKELRKLQSQVDKIVVKEKKYDEKIQKLEGQMAKQSELKERLKNQLADLLKKTIPDYQYAMTTLKETIDQAERKKVVIEKKFKKTLDNHFEFNQMKKNILAAEEEQKEYEALVVKRREKQQIIDVDSIQEMTRIDDEIQAIDRKIEKEISRGEEIQAQYQHVIDLIAEFKANKKRILKKLYIER
jgi:hypothetical protein